MTSEKQIKVFVQSASGHDTIDTTQASLGDVVADQLKDDKWVTLEKADGSTEIMTKADLPGEDEDAEDSDEDSEDTGEDTPKKVSNDWANTLTGKGDTKAKATASKTFESRFENVISATATHKAKGG
jgi:hypothetical protein